ncbi:hypothetical protein D917_06220 [Trichinella nativa]|uniref:Uncharacterized protein n=1 Tax=Trichinella nativa TaxID=6335 RepID=A0A1Y3E8L5_9BILA|nr:hypothetical protein D917_06220 [Trichinella nativa]
MKVINGRNRIVINGGQLSLRCRTLPKFLKQTSASIADLVYSSKHDQFSTLPWLKCCLLVISVVRFEVENKFLKVRVFGKVDLIHHSLGRRLYDMLVSDELGANNCFQLTDCSICTIYHVICATEAL